MFYVGIDIAKYKHEATIIDSDGKALFDSISFSNTKDGCDKLLALFEKAGVVSESLIIGMEATGHYWLSVYAFLAELGYDVKVINPIQSEAFRKMYIRQTKNDSKDSFIIAQIMRFGQYSSTALSEENIVALRQLSRYRLSLVDSCSDCKRRVIALLDQKPCPHSANTVCYVIHIFISFFILEKLLKQGAFAFNNNIPL